MLLKYLKKLLFFTFLFLSLFLLILILIFVHFFSFDPRFAQALIVSPNSYLKNNQHKTNFLLLGIAGGNHQGADLTDTMIAISLMFEKSQIALLPLPRDIWLTTLDDKINSAYHYGEERKVDGGLVLAKAASEEVVGLPIHYALLIDFSGFKKTIDLLGGIDIYIEKSFDDFKYPIEGKENDLCDGDKEFKCRYKYIHFGSGWQHMDGEQALEFVRSRNAQNDEGTDFARSKRQLALLLAIRRRLISKDILLNLDLVKKLINTVQKSIKTDMSEKELLVLSRYIFFTNKDSIYTITLPTSVDNEIGKSVFINPPTWQYSGKWVLVPADESFDQIHEYVQCFLADRNCNFFESEK